MLCLRHAAKNLSDRDAIETKLLKFLQAEASSGRPDGERLFILGVQLDAVRPLENREHLLTKLSGQVPEPVFVPFREGFSYGNKIKFSKPRVSLTDTEFESLLAKIESEDVTKIRIDIEEAVAAFEHAAAHSGDSAGFVNKLHEIGKSLLRNPSRKAAVPIAHAVAQRAARMNGENELIWEMWARALAASDALGSAELLLWEAVRVIPTATRLRFQLCKLLSRKSERLSEAVALARETVDLMPRANSRNMLASVLSRSGDINDELEALELLVKTLAKEFHLPSIATLGSLLEDSRHTHDLGNL